MVRHTLIILQQMPEPFGKLYIKGLTSTGKHLSKAEEFFCSQGMKLLNRTYCSMVVALVLFLLNLNRLSAIFSASVSIAFNCNFEHVLGSWKNPF